MDKEKALNEIRGIVKDYFSKKKRIFIPGKTRIGVGSPIFDENEVTAVMNSLLTTSISQGESVRNFERFFADYIGIKHAVAVNSGSSANLLALTSFIENKDAKPGDEIIMPAATFSTVAFPAIQVGLIPVFVDVDKESYNISVDESRKAVSEKTSIIMPVHSLGNPAEMEGITEISNDNGLKMLEDCCEAHGASINGKKVGSFGDMATLSFYVAHNITTGEGGMIFTNSERYEELLRSVREFGRISQQGERYVKTANLGFYDKRYIFERMGYNVRMTDLHASFGIEQFKKLKELNDKRIENADYFIKKLSEYGKFIQLPQIRNGIENTFYTFQIVVRENAPFARQDIVNFLEQSLIETRPFFAGCLPDQPALEGKRIKVIGSLPVSRWLRDNAFFIGCHPGIGEEERNYVVDKISQFLGGF